MPALTWDAPSDRRGETGLDHGVLFVMQGGTYQPGVAWNGLISVTETPSGAEMNAQYADNMKYLNLQSAEDFGGTINAFTYPDAWNACDGNDTLATGVVIGQQSRATFGLAYRTRVMDATNSELGYKYHLVYGAQVSPSERQYQTVNDSPEALNFSWTFTTTPVPVTGKKATSILTVDATLPGVDSGKLNTFLAKIFGSESETSTLLLPDQVAAEFAA